MGLLDFLRQPTSVEQAVVAVEQKAMTGPGAYALEYGLPGATSWWKGTGGWASPKGMARAQALSHANPWMEKGERLVTGRVASLPWHLEDAEDNTIDDESPEHLRRIQQLLEKPSPYTRPEWTWKRLVKITARHMGVCNVGAWYLDSMDVYGIPREILYVNPARLTPQWTKDGQLRRWLVDAKDDTDDGDPRRILEPDEIRLFVLEPPDEGLFGVGLVEVADTKARLSGSTDRFATQTYGSGGRRGSWISPREGRLPDDVFDGLVLAMKNIADSPDATKRNIIAKAPLDITPQASTMQELQAAELMEMSRNDILLIWGIDIADAGIPGGNGLSSGQLREQARQSTWEGAVEPRVDIIEEGVQQLLDSWAEGIGAMLEFEFERPEFEDETPAYERAAKALQLPLRNIERRAILGLDPFGDPVLDNAVWLPAGISEAFMAPDADGKMPVAEPVKVAVNVTAPPVQQLMPGDELPMKASPLGRTRHTVDARVTPALRKDVAKVLAEARAEVLRVVGEKAAHLVAKPSDVRAVFNGERFKAALWAAIEPHLRSTADVVAGEAKKAIGHLNPAKADPPTFLENVVTYVLRRGGERIVEMERTTRDAITAAVRDVVSQGVIDGVSPADLAASLTERIGALSVWDDARAETIARTETMFAYNDAALTSYGEYGVTHVQAIDGDGDPECANRDGQTFTLDESLSIEDHPNGTLDWIPVIG